MLPKKKMLLVSESLLDRIDRLRGEMSREEFLSRCLETVSPGEVAGRPVSREEFEVFKGQVREMQKAMMEFIIAFCCEGSRTGSEASQELRRRPQKLA